MEIKRKLASIKTINDIQPIDGADSIECVTVDGWKVVSQKNIHSIGDRVVYFEVDSFLPRQERYAFLEKSCLRFHPITGAEGNRLRTIRLRGQISQGLILPLSDFTDIDINAETDDLTNALGIIKWEVPENFGGGIAKGSFPYFIPKTDQERLQNIYNKYSKLYKDCSYEVTLKLDGSSMTVYKNDGVIGVCSRNLDLVEDYNNTFWRVAQSSGAIDFVTNYFGNVAIQGELMGPGVQGNRERLKIHRFYVFDIYDVDLKCYRSPRDRHLLLMNTDLHIAVIEYEFKPFNYTLDELINHHYLKLPSLNHPIREGIVLKANDRNVPSFKIINNDFLLKEKD